HRLTEGLQDLAARLGQLPQPRAGRLQPPPAHALSRGRHDPGQGAGRRLGRSPSPGGFDGDRDGDGGRGPQARAHLARRLRGGRHLGHGRARGPGARTYYAVQKPFGPTLTPGDLAFRSPYNTRAVTGLPPTPIDSPQLSSMQAALQPSASDALYYVLSSDCVHHSFFKSAAQFAAA